MLIWTNLVAFIQIDTPLLDQYLAFMQFFMPQLLGTAYFLPPDGVQQFPADPQAFQSNA